MTKTCQVIPEPEPFVCSDAKPIDTLSMIWNPDGEFDLPMPGCDTLDKPTSLTFKYTGEACDPSANDQGSKGSCTDNGTLAGFVTITAEDSDLSVTPHG